MSEPMPSAKSEPEWAAFAAIDWADQKHFWRLVPAGSRQPEQGELENTPEAVEAWAAALQQRFGGRPIAVCLEQARGTLVYVLSKYAHLVLFPVHPTVAARYRETFCTGARRLARQITRMPRAPPTIDVLTGPASIRDPHTCARKANRPDPPRRDRRTPARGRPEAQRRS